MYSRVGCGGRLGLDMTSARAAHLKKQEREAVQGGVNCPRLGVVVNFNNKI